MKIYGVVNTKDAVIKLYKTKGRAIRYAVKLVERDIQEKRKDPCEPIFINDKEVVEKMVEVSACRDEIKYIINVQEV